MAGGFKAPGIKRIERDVSEVIAAAGTSVGALVGASDKGPVNRRVLITSDKQLVDTFGAPTGTDSDMAIYAGLEFLKESSALFFVRATHGGEDYASMEVPATSAGYIAPLTTGVAATATSAILLDEEYSDGNTKRQVDGKGGNYDVEKYTYEFGATGSVTLSAKPSSILIAAQGPGTYGNDVGISIVTCADTDYKGQFGFNWEMNYDDPNASAYEWTAGSKVSAMGTPSSATDALWKKVYRVNVYEKPLNADDRYWGAVSAETPVETYLVSNSKIKDTQGNNLYAPDVINSSSNYVYVKVKENTVPMSTLLTSSFVAPTNPNSVSSINSIISLGGGTDNKTSVTEIDKRSAWYLFTERESSSPNILIVPDKPASTDTGTGVIGTIKTAGNIAAERKDCIAVGQVGSTSQTGAQTLIDMVNTYYSFNNPSYVALYAGYDKVNDGFTGQTLLLPKAVFGATLMARTDEIAKTWDAPAGINRGIIGASNGQVKNYSENDIGFMYDNNINASKFIRGIGHVMWGQKTAQRKKSALDRINVRRLLLFLQNSIEPSLLPFLFEPNTDGTRSRVFSVVDGFLSGVLAENGVTEYEVVVDESNNTPEIIDNNQLNVDIYVQPTRTIEYIQLQTIVTRTGVSFSEV